MGRNFDFAPPEQATGNANSSHANLPDPIELPEVPEGGGMPELSVPTFEPLFLPSSASNHAVADLPDIPAADLPDIFGI